MCCGLSPQAEPATATNVIAGLLGTHRVNNRLPVLFIRTILQRSAWLLARTQRSTVLRYRATERSYHSTSTKDCIGLKCPGAVHRDARNVEEPSIMRNRLWVLLER